MEMWFLCIKLSFVVMNCLHGLIEEGSFCCCIFIFLANFADYLKMRFKSYRRIQLKGKENFIYR